MAWSLVDSASHFPAATNSLTTVDVQDGDLIVVLLSDRSGFTGTITVSDDGDATNAYVEAPNCPIVWKQADGTLRTYADVWLKVANATDAGSLTVEVDDIGDDQWHTTAVLRPGAGDNPVDLASMIGDVGGDDGTGTLSASTASVSPSGTYLKLGAGFIKKTETAHAPFSYDQDLSGVITNEDGSSTGMSQGLGIHLDSESVSQAFTFTVDTATDRTLLAAYVLIPEEASEDPANLQATVDGSDVTLTWDASF